MTAASDPFPREIAPGIFWISGCTEVLEKGDLLHSSISTYVIAGPQASLMVDTGNPTNWDIVEASLDQILGNRPLTWLVPTHPEVPHAGNVPRLVRKYPDLKMIGDTRDFHVHYPTAEGRLMEWPKEKPIELGDGLEFSILNAPIKDLANSVWGYESLHQVLFVSDAFAFAHYPNDTESDEPLHRPGECGLLSTELSALPQTHQALSITRGALSWTKYVPTEPFLDEIFEMLEKRPAKLIAPAHGNVIVELEDLLPVMREAYSGLVLAPPEVLISAQIQ
jgi:hypothetical protein